MLFTTPILALIGIATALVAQAPSDIAPEYNATLPYDLVDPTWVADESMGLGNLTFTGPHHVIAARIAALNPRWLTNASYLDEITQRASEDASLLSKRSNRVSQFCGSQQFAWGQQGAARQNAAYITKHYGTGWCMQAARSCSRWACSYNTALVTCNDESTDSYFTCPTLQQNANFLTEYCSSPGDHKQVNGQAFYMNPKYNVLVKGVDYGKWC